ncbi:oxygen-regulated protein 1-like [Syngnathoides biaculeatus]|uniref:oxygen-regulated protein 1-like n=1 Tax=Syngnathoides biaculeatus TaxID=300417 RepID=UPI002ADE0EA9|nr:oxygen-regulated protein 1-like [Syngnathoides biaculeatus]
MNELDLRRVPPDQSSGSLRTVGTLRHASVTDPIPSKRVCFYKSGDPQFGGLRMVVNNRTFKTFDALLDSLSKKVPLAFGVRNITTPRGVHAINTLDELEDGKSYICSDSRKVKPINLALARKKLAPWYHARPASSRRRTLHRPGAFSGRQEPVLVHTPKRLAVFRNGDPSVKHTVVLQKRSATTFEWILEYISEMMQFHVVKLHTVDGRRVEGLSSLILCSGMVVAAGKEPFRPANYANQKSSGSTMPSGNQMSVRRLKTLNQGKKKSRSHGSKSRNFSTSSERYIVNKIHNSLMESSCDLPSQPSNSLEYESGHVLAETEGEEQDCMLPDEDDIEKSFRVNQDGSMTVEMRVRLTVKEEETLHWTTTLTRSSVANHLNMACLPEPESDQDVCATAPDLEDPVSFSDIINKNESKDDHDQEPPSLGNGVLSQSSYEEDAVKIQATSPRRASDFSSQVASTFGSSSKVLLAFLSIVALKDSIAILNVDQVKANDVSCDEALKMIESLREIASMEDPHRLEESVSALQESTSSQLLDSWSSFQEIGGTYQVLHDIIEAFDVPNTIKEELMSLLAAPVSESYKKLMADSEGSSSGMEEQNDELAHDDEVEQKMNSYHVLHSAEVQISEEEREDKPQGEDCYVELNPSRKESPDKEQSGTDDKVQGLDKPQPVQEKGLNLVEEESQCSSDKENEEEIINEMLDNLEDDRLISDSNPESSHAQDPSINDSGDDQSGCDEHTEASMLECEQTRSSTEEELSFHEKVSHSEEEHGYFTECQVPVTETKCDKVAVAKDLSDEEMSQPVAVRVSLLEKQVADAQKTRYNKHAKNISLVSEDSMETFQQCSRSAPQSSLSFSYDSSGVVTVEPEGNRVKSIREMFLAKSSADSGKRSQSTESQSDRSGSGGYQSRMSSEQSSGEEDPVRKSISKGFVRRTIERLYGKSNVIERLPQAPRKKKKHPNIFSPFHTARCKAASELSYFNSTNALDTLTEATRCIAFNAQVGPRDSVPIDEGRWLIRENTLIRKSISDPTGINKSLVTSGQDEDNCEDTQEDTPYSLFSTTSEPEDHKKSKRCTYFSLPHTSDSEVCQDEQSLPEANAESAAKTKPEKNGSAVGMPDNKVHPLVEIPVDGEAVVVAQPKKGHGVVSQSLQEPDVLDLLYNFCGENCPIL